ncbi:hypothetical protein SDJN02_24243, partial [Cucurbita argyrosperma subsp. argyrosperma]
MWKNMFEFLFKFKDNLILIYTHFTFCCLGASFFLPPSTLLWFSFAHSRERLTPILRLKPVLLQSQSPLSPASTRQQQINYSGQS